jgi:hypothetical protein
MASIDAPDTAEKVQSEASAAPPVVADVNVTGPAMRADEEISDRYCVFLECNHQNQPESLFSIGHPVNIDSKKRCRQ